MFNQNDPRSWGKAAAAGAVAGFTHHPLAHVAREAQAHIDQKVKVMNHRSTHGFVNTRKLRNRMIHNLGLEVLGKA